MDFRYDKIIYNTLYFLQTDDIMLHFTLSGSSDITDWSLMFTFLFTFLFTWKVAGDLKFRFKFGIAFESKLKGFFDFFLNGYVTPV